MKINITKTYESTTKNNPAHDKLLTIIKANKTKNNINNSNLKKNKILKNINSTTAILAS